MGHACIGPDTAAPEEQLDSPAEWVGHRLRARYRRYLLEMARELQLATALLAGLEVHLEFLIRTTLQRVVEVRPHPADGLGAVDHGSSPTFTKPFLTA